MTQPVIEIEHVAKAFGKRLVLRDVSMTVERGKTYAFLGRNGEGKTTTIQMLLGLLKQDEGLIRVLGLDPQAEPIKLRDQVGYLAEDQTMYGWMRVEELVRFVAPFYTNWDHDLAARYLEEFELPLRTKVKQLSKGQNVRLGLVLALAHRPELVILDDPALGLDPIMRKAFNRDLITHLQGEGRTVFYSSHLLDEVEPVADRVAILDGGRIVRDDDTDRIREDVKRLFISPEQFPTVERYGRVLDVRPDGDELAVTVEGAEVVIDRLARDGLTPNVIGLSLDEIFEAYVAGRPKAPSRPTEPESVEEAVA